MKRFFKSLALVLIAIVGMFAFTGCGDEFANAQEISKEDALAFVLAHWKY